MITQNTCWSIIFDIDTRLAQLSVNASFKYCITLCMSMIAIFNYVTKCGVGCWLWLQLGRDSTYSRVATQITQNRVNVWCLQDVGLMLYRWYTNVLYLLWWDQPLITVEIGFKLVQFSRSLYFNKKGNILNTNLKTIMRTNLKYNMIRPIWCCTTACRAYNALTHHRATICSTSACISWSWPASRDTRRRWTNSGSMVGQRCQFPHIPARDMLPWLCTPNTTQHVSAWHQF